MDKLVAALGPAFAAGFAVQQLLELADPIISRIIGNGDKKLILSLISLLIGLGAAFGAGLRVLQPLGIAGAGLWDGIVTGLVISAGTEGFNSIMKFLGYTKEERKGEAAAKKKAAADALTLVERR